ncbi:MAG: caspase family protein [Bacteroidia bacterium]|nr:caspase family protein [Bacteroidia bacterium]
MAGKIYALIIGIDDYPAPVPKLSGCIHDANAMKAYLENRFPKDSLFIKTLFDKDASRLNILQQFEGHLGKAGKDDFAIFFYAGHGSQEKAHEAFWSIEPDKKNETLVCWDSRIEDGMDLADKELATLIDLVAEKCDNVVLMVDACHSGGITRNIGEDEVQERAVDMDVRAESAVNRTRSLDSYFVRTVAADEADGATGRSVHFEEVKVIVPSPRHIAMSGASSFQTAKETTLGRLRRGVFTFSLIKVLEESPVPLSYTEILRRVRALVTNKANDQMPQLDAEIPADAERLFLSTVKANNNLGFLLYYDTKNIGGWVIGAGQLLGIQTNAKVLIYKASVQDLKDKTSYLGKGTVMNATGAYSIIGADFVLDTTLHYKVVVLPNVSQPKSGFIVISDTPAATGLLQTALETSPTAKTYTRMVATPTEADYVLYAYKGDFMIGNKLDGMVKERGVDKPSVPLATQITGYSAQNAEKAITYMEHIGRWKNTLDLGNPISQLDASQFVVTVYQVGADGTQTPIGVQFYKDATKGKNQMSNIVFGYTDDNNLPKFQIKVENKSGQRLYFSLLLLSSQFGVFNAFKEVGYWLKPDEFALSRTGRFIVPKEFRAFGRKEVTENYKLIVSTEEFDPRLLIQDDLGLPKPNMRGGLDPLRGLNKIIGDVQNRGVMFDDEDTEAPSFDWTTVLTQVKVKYNGV